MNEHAPRIDAGFAPPGSQPALPCAYAPPQTHAHLGPTTHRVAAPTGRRTWVVVSVTAAVSGLVGLLLGVTGTLAAQSLDDPVGAAAPDEGRQAADVVPERLPELVAWVEQRTGREFETWPEVVVLPQDEFEDALLGPLPDGAVEPASLPTDDFTATATALGLVEDPDAYDSFTQSGFAEGATGFYDTTDEVIRLRGTTWNPTTEVTLVHELVHALQDQVVDLDAVRAETAYYDETYQALVAVVEGQATVVEQDWLVEQGEDYAERYYQDGSAGGEAYEPLGAALMWLPYDLGGWAVGVLEGAEGPQATFEVLAAPPTTLEQVWDVEGWRSGDAEQAGPADLDTPEPPGGQDVLDRGSLGVHLLSMLTLDDPDAYSELVYQDELPLEGWAGDEYVTWADGDRACTGVELRGDSPDAASGLVEDLQPWVVRGGSAEADGSTVRLLRCSDG